MEIMMSTVAEVEEKIQALVNTKYPDYEVEFKDVQKPEGTRRGVTLRKKGGNVAPTAYLSENDTRKVDVAAREVVQMLIGAIPEEELDLSMVNDYERAKTNLTYKLVNKIKGATYLSGVVHADSEYENIAIVPVIKITMPDGDSGAIAVTESLIGNWELDSETVVRDAKTNAPKITPMKEMKLPGGLGLEVIPFRIFTNELSTQGAAVMTYPEFFKMLDKKYEDGVYIIPSSVHEILVMKSQGEFGEEDEIERVKGIIGAVNSQEVRPEDYLSDNLYGYKDGVVRSW